MSRRLDGGAGGTHARQAVRGRSEASAKRTPEQDGRT